MTQAATATLLLVLVGLAPTTQAEAPQAPGSPTASLDAACAPPCGYINPHINVEIPDKPGCGIGTRLGGDIEPEDCYALPADGERLEVEATLQWYWEMSEEGTYPNDPQEDIVISFSGSSSNPDWLSTSVAPSEFVLTSADLLNPDNTKREESDGGMRVWFWFERPITITIARDGGPSPEESQEIAANQGIEVFFLKAKSTASGDRFRAAFGIEEFRFYSLEDDAVLSTLPQSQDKDTPGLGLTVGLGALAALAVAWRRRR